jgi:energy-coupling factor transporter ATP-binding protein EcfA2
VKRLQAIRLVQWYHFDDEVLRLDGSCLLLGDNGSGKSTVLDAVQWALVADQTQIRFNKAANEQSHRTLHSYVRHKLGSEDETRPGQVRYGRGACTSYVALQFGDDRDPGAGFTCGLVMEASEADTTVNRWHFVLPGVRVEEAPFVVDDAVQTARDFRSEARERVPGARIFPDAATYRDEIRHRLGALPQTFHRLLVKALDFKPIGQVRDFVFHYLLDAKPVDTQALQQNLEHYKRLEGQAQDARRRLAALDAICEHGERIAQERRTLDSHRYIYLRADVDIADEKARTLGERHDEAVRLAGEAERSVKTLEDRRTFLDRDHERVLAELVAAPAFRELQALRREREDVARQATDAEAADRRARRLLDEQQQALELLLGREAREVRRLREGLFDDDLVGAAEEPAAVARLRETLARNGALGGRDLGVWTRRLDRAGAAIRYARFRLEEELERAKREGGELQAERADLERGRLRYPEGVEALLHLLAARMKTSHAPRPLCELIEVPAERWRDAVEGYLNTRRFDVICAPEDFPRALALYEKHKRGYPIPGRGEVFIANVGLVDGERVQAASPRAQRRSLAAEVATDDPAARRYIDYLLGDVICCDEASELRQHARAVTDTVMVYQNHVARQTPPDVYRRHWIGQAARIERIDEIDRRLAELSALVVELAPAVQWLKTAETATTRAAQQAVLLPELVAVAERLPELAKRIETLDRALERVDQRQIDALERERARLDAERQHNAEEIKEQVSRIAEHRKDAELLAGAREGALEEGARARETVRAAFEEAGGERPAAYEARYREERTVRLLAEIRDVFERQHRGYEQRVRTSIERFVKLKTEYVNAFGFAGEALGDRYEEFDAERTLWRDSRLPEYETRIVRAKEEALQQLAEDIIFRLRENLVDVRRQIDQLNRALRDVAFGSERYQFTIEVEPEHREFHDLIMAAGQFEKDSLFGNAALTSTEMRRTLQELFDRLLAAEAEEVRTELDARADYREYFRYDLKIHHADGTWSMYDRVAGDKSGGETQTPYYIAILASLYRVYRSGSADARPTCGLVLLDEAFAKMDEARIQATLRFARELELQLVVATPKERSELVAPWMETSLYIYKDAHTGAPQVLDFTKELGHAADQERSAPGAPA